MDAESVPAVRGFKLTWPDSLPLLLFLGIFAQIWVWQPSDNVYVFWEMLGIVVIAMLGYALGGYRGLPTSGWLRRRCDLSEGEIDALTKELQRRRDDFDYPDRGSFREIVFLTYVAFFTVAYLGFYQYSLVRLAEHSKGQPPIPEAVVAVTALTIGALGMFAARYAAYIRLATLLQAAVSWKKDKRIVEHLRCAVFRDEQLCEPPGNIFVTVGIAATFLGLTMGLVQLDLTKLFVVTDAAEAANASAGASNDGSNGKLIALASLSSFVACMGLALGVSMLGVLASVAAQWLRGHGPDISTEHLLELAETVHEAPVAETAGEPAQTAAKANGSNAAAPRTSRKKGNGPEASPPAGEG